MLAELVADVMKKKGIYQKSKDQTVNFIVDLLKDGQSVKHESMN